MPSDLVEQPQLEAARRGNPATILIVDDDDAMVTVLNYRLSRQGYRVLAARDGEAGLAAARLHHPDLLLLDLRLPGRDGFSVCHELSDSAETCGIPVIILSGMERPDIIRRSRAAGCHYFVRKPYDPNALLVLVEHAIGETGRWQIE